MNKFLSFLGLCRKAGRLVLGFDSVKEAIQNNTVEMILFTSDVSQKTKKEILFCIRLRTIKVHNINICMDDFMKILGKRSGIIAITDPGFSKKLSQLISQEELDI